MMNKEEFIEFLTKNLEVRVKMRGTDYEENKRIVVELVLDGIVIDSDYDYL